MLGNVKPATTRGPVTGSNLRVVYDETKAVVVSSQNTTYLQLTGPVQELGGGKLILPTSEGDLTVVRQGGCSCGKPWLSRPSSTDLLAGAPA